MTCSSCATSAMIFRFHSCIRSFSTWRSWVAICWMGIAPFLLARMPPRVSYLVPSRLVTLPLVALSAPTFSSLPLSKSASISWCRASFSLFPGVATAIALRALYATGASIVSTSINHPSWTSIPLKITITMSQNDIPTKLHARYTIKNRFRRLWSCVSKSFVF